MKLVKSVIAHIKNYRFRKGLQKIGVVFATPPKNEAARLKFMKEMFEPPAEVQEMVEEIEQAERILFEYLKETRPELEIKEIDIITVRGPITDDWPWEFWAQLVFPTNEEIYYVDYDPANKIVRCSMNAPYKVHVIKRG